MILIALDAHSAALVRDILADVRENRIRNQDEGNDDIARLTAVINDLDQTPALRLEASGQVVTGMINGHVVEVSNVAGNFRVGR